MNWAHYKITMSSVKIESIARFSKSPTTTTSGSRLGSGFTGLRRSAAWRTSATSRCWTRTRAARRPCSSWTSGTSSTWWSTPPTPWPAAPWGSDFSLPCSMILFLKRDSLKQLPSATEKKMPIMSSSLLIQCLTEWFREPGLTLGSSNQPKVWEVGFYQSSAT